MARRAEQAELKAKELAILAKAQLKIRFAWRIYRRKRLAGKKKKVKDDEPVGGVATKTGGSRTGVPSGRPGAGRPSVPARNSAAVSRPSPGRNR